MLCAPSDWPGLFCWLRGGWSWLAERSASGRSSRRLNRRLSRRGRRGNRRASTRRFARRSSLTWGRDFSLTAFGGEIGVSRETLDAWRAKHPTFSQAVNVGEAARTRALEKKLLDANAGARVTAHVLALKCAAPEEWRDKAAAGEDGGGKPVKLELAIRFV